MRKMKNNLPKDLIIEILLRLPVKSLVRFRCVSKQWFSLISDPRFAKVHFKRKSDDNQRLLLSTPLWLSSLEIDAPFLRRNFYIWNPSTAEHRKLLDPGTSPHSETYNHGFGYDASTDDYKLLVATASYAVYQTHLEHQHRPG
ncbi:hypothetical protein I3760_08G155600 [Carya illinoinensis]|nr:hypothetical protein I3760_08G155600 [Carya illinoinensis]